MREKGCFPFEGSAKNDSPDLYRGSRSIPDEGLPKFRIRLQEQEAILICGVELCVKW